MKVLDIIKDFIFNLSLPKKLVLMITPIILVFTVSGFFTYNSSQRLLLGKVIESNLKTLEMIKNDILFELEKLSDTSLEIVIDVDVLEYVSFEFDNYKKLILKNRIEKNFADIMITNNMIENLCLIKSNTEYIYYEPSFSSLSLADVNYSVQTIFEANGDIQSGGFIKMFGKRNNNLLHYVRPIYGLIKHERNGLVVININHEYFNKVLDKYKDGNLYYIIDGYGGFIYNENSSVNSIDILGNINSTRNTGYFVNREVFGDGLVLYSRLAGNDWIIAVQVPLSTIYAEINFLKYIFSTIGLISVMISILLIGMISFGFTRKIRGMVETMKKMEEGNLDIRYNARYKDEISQLGRGLNNMVDSIQKLMRNMSETEIKKREAELNALQSQINPHFLYNTLETIRMVAIVNEDRQAAHIIKVLANLFRYSINRGREIVLIDQEVQHMSNYLEIQKIRYADKFDVKINIDPNILRCKTIKLILQPIVENAIYHGIELKPGKGKIIITGRKCDNLIVFSVEDDGLGITPEELEALNKELSAPGRKEDKRSIGLKNVSDRIRLHFGLQYGVKIESRMNEGTMVKIIIPLIEDYEGVEENAEDFTC